MSRGFANPESGDSADYNRVGAIRTRSGRPVAPCDPSPQRLFERKSLPSRVRLVCQIFRPTMAASHCSK